MSNSLLSYKFPLLWELYLDTSRPGDTISNTGKFSFHRPLDIIFSNQEQYIDENLGKTQDRCQFQLARLHHARHRDVSDQFSTSGRAYSPPVGVRVQKKRAQSDGSKESRVATPHAAVFTETHSQLLARTWNRFRLTAIRKAPRSVGAVTPRNPYLIGRGPRTDTPINSNIQQHVHILEELCTLHWICIRLQG